MRSSLEPKGRTYVKEYGFMSFATSMSNKYRTKLVNTAKKSAANAIKTASKRAIQKAAEATGDLVGNKIADKITSNSKKKYNNNNDDVKLKTHKKRYISLEERQQIIDELRLVLNKLNILCNNIIKNGIPKTC